MSTVKGCNMHYKCLRKARTKGNPILERAVKWHEELGLEISVSQWRKAHDLVKEIKFDNKLKWMQFEI